jgi:riboflavin kinase/FMN adenylyltransferase
MGITQELANLVPRKETFLTIGVFDGIHLGHRYLLKKLIQRAREENLLSGVVTFDPHPQSVLHPHDQLPWLTNLENRVKSLQELGINLVAVLSFTPEVSQLGAQQFISLLKKYLKMRGLMMGPDSTLGKGREGNTDLLHSLGQEMGFSVETIAPFTVDGEIVSSTLIRQALTQGSMEKVENLLGHRFYLTGRVITGGKRGEALGFPTANLDVQAEQALPGNGVYATVTQMGGKQFASATNVGTRPTFDEGVKLVETHLLNYEGDLYGREIRIEFVQKLREELRFTSPEKLREQMGNDIREVEALIEAKGLLRI